LTNCRMFGSSSTTMIFDFIGFPSVRHCTAKV